jgi:hypothetical protein
MVILLMCSLLLAPGVSADPKEKEQLCKDALLTALNPAIQNAVNGYFGSPRQYGLYDAEIIKIERVQKGGFLFNVTVKVTTFVGSHNPPYGIETMTLAVDPGNSMVIDYQHKDQR